MKILYLAHRVPYPPNKGDKIRSYHHVRHLAQRHEVRVVAFVDEPEDERYASALREYCRDVVLIRLDKRAALLRGLRTLARGRTLSEGYFGAPEMQRAISRVAAANAFDVVWTYSSVMAQYLPAVNAARQVADFVDVDSEKWRQYSVRGHSLLRWAYRIEAARLRGFESRVSGAVERVLFVSHAEAELFRSFGPPTVPVEVIPNGVDTTYYRSSAPPASERQPIVLFTGALDYPPNIDAVAFFVDRVLPRVREVVPEVRFVAVGHRPSRRLVRRLAPHAAWARVAGSVPDVRPYFDEAHVYVAPLQAGRGVQNKVLEAMAMQVPVVASPLAVAALQVEPDRHVLVCQNPAEYAAAVITLLRGKEHCGRLVGAATELIRQRYLWSENLKLVERCLESHGPMPRHGTAVRAAL
jgi:sugar transferase (PEP-CTERM/EpsH1 system associated)